MDDVLAQIMDLKNQSKMREASQVLSQVGKASDTTLLSQDDKEVTNEIFINSLESVITDDGQLKDLITDEGHLKDLMATREGNKTVKINDDSQSKDAPPERRRSERLKKEILLTMLEKNEMMAKKRSLEGNKKIILYF